jgi:hypothetical protein
MKGAFRAVWTFLKKHPLGIILFAILTGVAGNYIYGWLHKQPEDAPLPLRADEFRIRFAVVSYSLTNKDLRKMPTLIHCYGNIAGQPIGFELQLIPVITSRPPGYNRSSSVSSKNSPSPDLPSLSFLRMATS